MKQILERMIRNFAVQPIHLETIERLAREIMSDITKKTVQPMRKSTVYHIAQKRLHNGYLPNGIAFPYFSNGNQASMMMLIVPNYGLLDQMEDNQEEKKRFENFPAGELFVDVT